MMVTKEKHGGVQIDSRRWKCQLDGLEIETCGHECSAPYEMTVGEFARAERRCRRAVAKRPELFCPLIDRLDEALERSGVRA